MKDEQKINSIQHYNKNGEFDKVLQIVGELIKKEPDNGYYFFIKGQALYNKNQFANAEIDIKQALYLGYDEDACNRLLAVILFMNSNYKMSLKYLEKALAKDSNDAFMLSIYARTRFYFDSPYSYDKYKSDELIEKALELAPESVEVLKHAFYYEVDRLRHDRAKDILDRYLKVSENEYERFKLLAQYAECKYNYNEALNYYKKAYEINAEDKIICERIKYYSKSINRSSRASYVKSTLKRKRLYVRENNKAKRFMAEYDAVIILFLLLSAALLSIPVDELLKFLSKTMWFFILIVYMRNKELKKLTK